MRIKAPPAAARTSLIGYRGFPDRPIPLAARGLSAVLARVGPRVR
jgi:hypothetical protein